MTTEFEALLQEFAPLPKAKKKPTFLELCKYPGSRFEEICSRLLCFYFSPTKEHGLGDLFIRCLFSLLEVENEIIHDQIDIKVINEDNAEGKRIDLLIYSNQFVVGIENKINASLYNDLETYKRRIDKYSIVNKYYVVLSLRQISDQAEKFWMEHNKFVNITYKQLFEKVQRQIVTHKADVNNQYILYLKDFINTLNNMSGQNILNRELSDFFYKNSDKLDDVVARYKEFKDNIFNIQRERIKSLKQSIEIETNLSWWIWDQWVLGATFLNKENVKIGIESYYDEIGDDPLGLFTIQIVTWSLNDWNIYENDLLQQFPGNMTISKNAGKCSILIETINNNDEELILHELNKYSSVLKQLTKLDEVQP